MSLYIDTLHINLLQQFQHSHVVGAVDSRAQHILLFAKIYSYWVHFVHCLELITGEMSRAL